MKEYSKSFAVRSEPSLHFRPVSYTHLDLVGLFKVGGHFGKQAVGRDADIDREAQLPAHARCV